MFRSIYIKGFISKSAPPKMDPLNWHSKKYAKKGDAFCVDLVIGQGGGETLHGCRRYRYYYVLVLEL